jgi:hypothetical protein
MRFGPADLERVEELLEGALAVVPMRRVYEGMTDEHVIGLRHDIDDNVGALETAVKIALWEHERGYRSTFYFLHTASYFDRMDALEHAVDTIAACGHEIGIHANAIAAALRVGGDPDHILAEGLWRLRGFGHPVVGVAAHGDEMCHRCGFVNDEQFVECPRPECGEPDRLLRFDGHTVRLTPRRLASFGLRYDTHRLPHGRYLSDSGGRWNEPFPGYGSGQLHMLWHPDWWSKAFTSERVALTAKED